MVYSNTDDNKGDDKEQNQLLQRQSCLQDGRQQPHQIRPKQERDREQTEN